MGIAVGDPARGQQLAGVLQGLHHVAVHLEHVPAREQGHVVLEQAPGVDRIGHVDAVLHAEGEVVGAVARRHVDDPRAGLHVDEIGGQEGHVEVIAPAVQGVAADGPVQAGGLGQAPPLGYLERAFHRFGEVVGDDKALAGDGQAAVFHRDDLVDAVGEAGAVGQRPVAGDGPRRGRPDDDGGALKLRRRRLQHGKAHVNNRRRVVVVFDLGFRQRRLFHHRPQHRPGALVERAVEQEFSELAHDLGLGGEGHGGVGGVPVADDAEPFELPALDVDPVVGELAAFLAELDDGHLVLVLARGPVALLDLPFDGQAVAVPAGHVVRVPAQHLLGTGDHVLENLVERVADVQVPVGIGRSVVEDELLAPLGRLAVPAKQVHGGPALEHPGFALGQSRAHGKIGVGQEHRRFIVHAHFAALRLSVFHALPAAHCFIPRSADHDP